MLYFRGLQSKVGVAIIGNKWLKTLLLIEWVLTSKIRPSSHHPGCLELMFVVVMFAPPQDSRIEWGRASYFPRMQLEA